MVTFSKHFFPPVPKHKLLVSGENSISAQVAALSDDFTLQGAEISDDVVVASIM